MFTLASCGLAGCHGATTGTVSSAPASASRAPAEPERGAATAAADEDERPGGRAAPSPHRVACTFEEINPIEVDDRYRFHGVLPWTNLTSPTSASCCVLRSVTVLCLVSETMSVYLPVESGTLSIGYGVERVRLFDEGASAPWRDAVVGVTEGGPMRPRRRPVPPLLEARVDVDETAFRVVATTEGVCEQNEPLPCDGGIAEAGACAKFRKVFAPLVRGFCANLGEASWRGKRLGR